jgi:hypothetical protein
MNAQDPFSWLQRELAGPDDKAAAAANAEQMGDAALKEWEQARLFFDVFGTGRGPELLFALREATIELPLMDLGRSLVRGDIALTASEWAYVREGQNSIVRLIEGQIKIAKNPAPNVSAGDNQTEGEGDE